MEVKFDRTRENFGDFVTLIGGKMDPRRVKDFSEWPQIGSHREFSPSSQSPINLGTFLAATRQPKPKSKNIANFFGRLKTLLMTIVQN